MNTKNRVYQFKISLREIAPVVWRRIQVPTNYNFWDLHVAIQDSMGWLDYHLHQFSIKRPHAHKITEIGIPDDEGYYDDIELFFDSIRNLDSIELLKLILKDIAKDKNIFRRRFFIDSFLRKLSASLITADEKDKNEIKQIIENSVWGEKLKSCKA